MELQLKVWTPIRCYWSAPVTVRMLIPLLLVFTILLPACYLKTSITRHNDPASNLEPATTTSNKINFIEVVSGATKYEFTTNSGHRVRQTVGVIVGRQTMPSSGNYKIYSQSSGQITGSELAQ